MSDCKDFPRALETAQSRLQFTRDVRGLRRSQPQFADICTAILAKPHYVSWSVDSPKRIAYSPKGVHRYDYPRRQITTIGRFIGRNTEITNSQLVEQFAAKLLATRIAGDSFELLHGKAIRNAYRDSLGSSSCMCGDCAEYTQVYAENDAVRLLVYTASNGVTARALVWTCDDGARVLDRIYPSNGGAHIDAIRAHADANGWLYRVSSSLPSGTVELSDGSTREVTLKCSTDQWPYMDTFCYANGDSSCATLTNCSRCSCDAELKSTSGDFADGNSVRCDCCGERVAEDDSFYLCDEVYCDECRAEHFTWSDREDEYIHDNDICHIEDADEYASQYYVRNHCHCCEDCGDWFDEAMEAPDGNMYCDTHYCDHVGFCEECEEYVMVNELDENCHCEDCAALMKRLAEETESETETETKTEVKI